MKRSVKERIAELKKDLTPTERKILEERIARPMIAQALGTGLLSMLENASGKELRIEVGEPCPHPNVCDLVSASDHYPRVCVQGAREGTHLGWCRECRELLMLVEGEQHWLPFEAQL